MTLRMSIEDHSSGIERSAAALGHRVGLRSMSMYIHFPPPSKTRILDVGIHASVGVFCANNNATSK